MKDLLLFFVTFLLFTNVCQAQKADFRQANNRRNISKTNVISQIVTAIGPDIVLQYLLDNYTKASEYLLNDVWDTLKPENPSECVEDSFQMLRALSRLEYWATQMLDAQGKLAGGVMDGNIIWYGSYKACSKVKQQPPYSASRLKPFYGKFCWIEFNIDIERFALYVPLPKSVLEMQIPPLKWAVCVPNSCSEDEIANLTSSLIDFEFLRKLIELTVVSCLPHQKNIWTDWNTIFALGILITFGAVTILATIIDLLTKQQKLVYLEPYIVTGSESKRNLHEANNVSTSIREPHQQPAVKDEEGVIKKAIVAFSLHRNFFKLVKTSKYEITCINGIRCMSMLWIITYQTVVSAVLISDNLLSAIELIDVIIYEIVVSGVLAVDTFFLLSGLLVSYTFWHGKEKNQKTSWIKFYVFRYIRITPLYVLFIHVFENTLVKYIAVGPFWPKNGYEGENCINNWWWNILYINNFMPTKDVCLVQSWYLATDMQFFMLSPIILLLLSRSVFLGVFASGIFILISWMSAGIISYGYGIPAEINIGILHPKTEPYYQAVDNFYFKPYLHIAPYVIGLLLGWLLFKTKFQQKLKMWMVYLGWTLSIASYITLTLGLFKANDRIGLVTASVYHVFSRTLWAIMLGWIIFACSNGFGGIINSLLSASIFKPLSRLTYSAFLMHALVINVVFDQANFSINFSYVTCVWHIIGNIVIIYLLSVPLSLLFEMPFLELLKLRSKSSTRSCS